MVRLCPCCLATKELNDLLFLQLHVWVGSDSLRERPPVIPATTKEAQPLCYSCTAACVLFACRDSVQACIAFGVCSLFVQKESEFPDGSRE